MAVTVLVAGVLLLQHVPLRPLAHQLAGAPTHGCTEQVCHCTGDCTCSHCTHQHEAGPSEKTDGRDEAGAADDGLTLRSCSGPAQAPLGAFVVAKCLPAPGTPAPAAWLTAEVFSTGRAMLALQAVADELFRPPRA